MSQLTSPTRVKKFLLQYAKDKKAHKFTRVSQATMDQIEASCRAHCIRLVESAPSRGQTL